MFEVDMWYFIRHKSLCLEIQFLGLQIDETHRQINQHQAMASVVVINKADGCGNMCAIQAIARIPL